MRFFRDVFDMLRRIAIIGDGDTEVASTINCVEFKLSDVIVVARVCLAEMYDDAFVRVELHAPFVTLVLEAVECSLE